MLRALLDSIAKTEAPSHLLRLAAVVVVDNDAAQSAASMVAAMADEYPCSLIYTCEPQRNIARARNLGAHTALELSPDFLAFTDDDCIVSANWLGELVHVAGEYHADVVSGPLRHLFPPGTPRWLVQGGFPDGLAIATGSVLKTAESNNALIRARLLRTTSEPFDPAFGISGGSDSLLFIRLRNAGARIVRAADAVVMETVPSSRLHVPWILQRAYRRGNAGVFTYRAALPTLRWFPGRALKGLGHVAIGTGIILTGLFRGRATLLTGMSRLSLGAGILGALFGHRYFEYQRVHGE
jgi:succinoglycan biosynthesis protein ExoM